LYITLTAEQQSACTSNDRFRLIDSCVVIVVVVVVAAAAAVCCGQWLIVVLLPLPQLEASGSDAQHILEC
jgi:hypothetical protein